jgi:signal transduction histidine kinase
VLACAAVIVRRVAPLPVAGIVTAALVVFAVRDYPGGPLLIPVIVALYTAGTAVERNVALTVGAAVGAVAAARAWLTAVHGNVSAFTWAAPGWVLAALAWGAAVRSRRQLLEAARLRAELAEQTREAEAEQRADQERLRIARDLHDVIGHSFAAVNVQARAAAAVLDTDRALAREPLGAIESVSGTALAEIRRALGLLRHGSPPAEAASLANQVSLLARPLREAGIKVDLTVDAGATPLPPAVSEAVCRIVQESLTNVLRHAAASAVRLTVARAGDRVQIEIGNDSRHPAARMPPAGSDGGHGIQGMRERAAAMGGTLSAGPEGAGFLVAATLPAAEGTP